jgi:hypothetical protein
MAEVLGTDKVDGPVALRKSQSRKAPRLAQANWVVCSRVAAHGLIVSRCCHRHSWDPPAIGARKQFQLRLKMFQAPLTCPYPSSRVQPVLCTNACAASFWASAPPSSAMAASQRARNWSFTTPAPASSITTNTLPRSGYEPSAKGEVCTAERPPGCPALQGCNSRQPAPAVMDGPEQSIEDRLNHSSSTEPGAVTPWTAAACDVSQGAAISQ